MQNDGSSSEIPSEKEIEFPRVRELDIVGCSREVEPEHSHIPQADARSEPDRTVELIELIVPGAAGVPENSSSDTGETDSSKRESDEEIQLPPRYSLCGSSPEDV
jgi:hypothetical protein